MRRPSALAAVCLLVGCSQPAPTNAPSPAPAAKQVTVEDTARRWAIQEWEGEMSLGRAPPESDAYGVMFGCKPGTGKVEIAEHAEGEHPEGSTWDGTFELRSDDITRAYSGKGVSDEFEARVTASTTVADPLLEKFARTGRLKSWWGSDDASSDVELGRIRQFFDRCRG